MVKSDQVTVNTSPGLATLIYRADADGVDLLVTNHGPGTVYIGSPNASPETGYALEVGWSISMDLAGREAVYGISEGPDPAIVHTFTTRSSS